MGGGGDPKNPRWLFFGGGFFWNKAPQGEFFGPFCPQKNPLFYKFWEEGGTKARGVFFRFFLFWLLLLYLTSFKTFPKRGPEIMRYFSLKA